MSARSSRGKKPSTGRFFALPLAVLSHPDFIGLSGSAVKLLIALGSQFNGKNNGDLCAALSLMRKFGFNSNATLTKAKNELLEYELIVQTRVGGLNAGPHLYALTWHPIDECKGKLDIGPTIKALRSFSAER